MKIQASLRLYVLMTSLILLLGVAVLYTFLTTSYFHKGLDQSTQWTMIRIANHVELSDLHQAELLGYHVTDKPSLIPEEVLSQLNSVPSKPFEYKKVVMKDTPYNFPKSAYMVMNVPTDTGETRYVSMFFENQQASFIETFVWDSHIAIATYIGLILIVTFIVLLAVVTHAMTKPVIRMCDWAASLNQMEQGSATPDFRYTELNVLADIMQANVTQIRQGIEREETFLRYASHELRTPVATLSNNIELLQLVRAPNDMNEAQILQRMGRSCKNMSQLINTLLWLSREENKEPLKEKVRLDEVIRQTKHELSYLLEGKPVKVYLAVEPYSTTLALVPAQIVITNLIKNAFQHTLNGTVHINLKQGELVITNSDDRTSAIDSNKVTSFGLGLTLVSKLTNRFGWSYQSKMLSTGYETRIVFRPSPHSL